MLNRFLVIIFVIASAVGYSVYQKNLIEKNLVSASSSVVLSSVPDVEFSTLEGKSFALKDLYKSQKIDLLIVHFWGTWCAPCEAELPELLKLAKHYESNTAVKFLLVAVNDEVSKVKKHIKTLPLSSESELHWLLDTADVYRHHFNTTRVPETYVFSSDKSTLRKFVGPQEWNKTMFFQAFDDLIQISTRKL